MASQAGSPQLKYSQLAADASSILTRDEAAAFQASDKLHVLGCLSGHVHVLDFEGNQVRDQALQRRRAFDVVSCRMQQTTSHGCITARHACEPCSSARRHAERGVTCTADRHDAVGTVASRKLPL
jgi:hypothetical protein